MSSSPSLSIPFAVYPSEGIPRPVAGRSKIHEPVGALTGATMAGGLVTFNEIDTGRFKLWYDEVLFLHSCEGTFELEYDGKVHPMQVGDIAWIRGGTTVVYRAAGIATLFFAVNPPDWRHRRPVPKAPQ